MANDHLLDNYIRDSHNLELGSILIGIDFQETGETIYYFATIFLLKTKKWRKHSAVWQFETLIVYATTQISF